MLCTVATYIRSLSRSRGENVYFCNGGNILSSTAELKVDACGERNAYNMCKCTCFSKSKTARTTVRNSKTLISSTSFHLPCKHSVYMLRLRNCAGISANSVSLYHSSPYTLPFYKLINTCLDQSMLTRAC